MKHLIRSSKRRISLGRLSQRRMMHKKSKQEISIKNLHIGNSSKQVNNHNHQHMQGKQLIYTAFRIKPMIDS